MNDLLNFVGGKLLSSLDKLRISQWIKEDLKENIKLDFKLAYCGSRDGFTAAAFHRLCDNRGPSVVVIQSTNGNIFGGYTPLPWKSDEKAYNDASNSSFIFILRNHTNIKPCKMRQRQGNYAIYCNSTYGPTLGNAHDIYISDNCSTIGTSYCNPGFGFHAPSPYVYRKADTKALMAGTRNFKVKEIEVYI